MPDTPPPSGSAPEKPVPGTSSSQPPGSTAAAAGPAPPSYVDLEQRISEKLMQKVETELVDKIAGKMADLMKGKADAKTETPGQTSSASAAASSKEPAADGNKDPADDDDSHSTRKDRQNTYSSWGDSSWDWVSEKKEWWSGWSSSRDWEDKNSRPYLSHLTIPEFNGNPDGYNKYKYLVQNLKYQYQRPQVLGTFLDSQIQGSLPR